MACPIPIWSPIHARQPLAYALSFGSATDNVERTYIVFMESKPPTGRPGIGGDPASASSRNDCKSATRRNGIEDVMPSLRRVTSEWT